MGICLYLQTELRFSCSTGDAAFPLNGRDVGFPKSASPAQASECNARHSLKRNAPLQALGWAVIDLLSASARGAAGRDRCYQPHL